jgi:hypothetical protein
VVTLKCAESLIVHAYASVACFSVAEASAHKHVMIAGTNRTRPLFVPVLMRFTLIDHRH